MNRISLIIPAWRNWDGVRRCLRSVLEKGDDGDLEVIIVNNDPSDTPPQDWPFPIVADDQFPRLKILECPTPGSYAARNRGAQKASGQLLWFVDSDCVVERGSLENLKHLAPDFPLRQIGAGAIRLEFSPPGNIFTRFEEITTFRVHEDAKRFHYAATANMIVTREFFFQLGGFDSTLFSCGDFEFGQRARQNGGWISVIESVGVRHPARGSWRKLRRRHQRVQGGLWELKKKGWSHTSILSGSRTAAILRDFHKRPLWEFLALTGCGVGLTISGTFERMRLKMGKSKSRE